MSRILPLTDCGVTDTPENESLRSSLIREVYAFLDQSVSLSIDLSENLLTVFVRLHGISLSSLLLDFSSLA